MISVSKCIVFPKASLINFILKQSIFFLSLNILTIRSDHFYKTVDIEISINTQVGDCDKFSHLTIAIIKRCLSWKYSKQKLLHIYLFCYVVFSML